MKVDGQCHCGAITYEAQVEPNTIQVCHCADCQRLSGTAFRANVAARPLLSHAAPQCARNVLRAGVDVRLVRTFEAQGASAVKAARRTIASYRHGEVGREGRRAMPLRGDHV